MGAAPSGDDARTVVERSRLRHGRVSWERLLCGDGLALFDAVARGADEAAEPADVAARALSGDAAARRAASEFAHALGEFAGDLCLAFSATGGVYLTGGVLDGLGRALDADALREGFEDKGRFRDAVKGSAVLSRMRRRSCAARPGATAGGKGARAGLRRNSEER